jgi:hypothetical protein
MLVLALEFSRGCTAHTGVGTPSPRSVEQAKTERSRNKPPDQGTRGARGHRRHAEDLNDEVRCRTPATRGAPEGLDSIRWRHPTLSSDERRGDVTGNDPTGHSLKTEQ